MRPIFDRCPSLRTPFLSLANLPTPVRRMGILSRDTGADLWIKRDDLNHPELGGGKLRKFEFLAPLADLT